MKNPLLLLIKISGATSAFLLAVLLSASAWGAAIDTEIFPLIKKNEVANWKYPEFHAQPTTLLVNPNIAGANNAESELDFYVVSIDSPTFKQYPNSYGSYESEYSRHEYFDEYQWKSTLTKYWTEVDTTETDDDKQVKATAQWEFGKKLNNQPKRSIRVWNGGTSGGLETLVSGDTPDDSLARRLGMSTDVEGKENAKKIIDWLYGDRPGGPKNSHLFNDIGQSGYVVVGSPTPISVTNRPGHREYYSAQKTRKPMLYIQTNGGTLHAVNARAGKSDVNLEEWAFVPPNALERLRVAGLQFELSNDITDRSVDKNITSLTWLDGSGKGASGDKVPITNPAYVLDGALTTIDLDSSGKGTGWGSYLFGSMGRGGAGLYAMDVTKPSSPKFAWALENNLYSLNTRDAGTVYRWDGGDVYSDNYQLSDINSTGNVFAQLGWNAPKPAIGTVKTGKNVMVLAGGLQYSMDLKNNGTVGAAIYLLDPITGAHIKTFNSSSAIADSSGTDVVGPDPKMGMMLTPPTVITDRSSQKFATHFVTADNRGHIFVGKFEDDPDDTTLKELFSFRGLNDARPDKLVLDNYPIPHEMVVAWDTVKKEFWVFGGTSDVYMRTYGEDTSMGQLLDDTRRGEYYLTGTSDQQLNNPAKDWDEATLTTNFPYNSGTNTAYKGSHFIFGIRNITGESGLKKDDIKEMSVKKDNDQLDANHDMKGWVLRLHGRIEQDYGWTNTLNREYVSAPPLLLAGNLYVATFAPGVGNYLKDATRIYCLNPFTGAGEWDNGKGGKSRSMFFEGMKITSLAPYTVNGKMSLMLSAEITELKYLTNDGWAIPNDTEFFAEEFGKLGENSEIEIGDVGGSVISPDEDFIQYWREVF